MTTAKTGLSRETPAQHSSAILPYKPQERDAIAVAGKREEE
ncbi:MAG TPA: hypothetical protein VIT22_07655 [Pseudoxanthomonas sp.]